VTGAVPDDALCAALLEASTDGLLIVDRGLAVIAANAALRAMLGEATIAAGGRAGALFEAEDRAAMEAMLRAALLGGAPAACTARLAGQAPRCEIAAIAVRDADATVGALVLRVAAAAARMQAVGQMALGVAHDFNNVLTAILAAAELALDRPETDPAAAQELRHIRASAQRGTALVRLLLGFGHAEPAPPRAVALNAAIEALAPLLARLLGDKIGLVLDRVPPDPVVRIDPAQLDRILINLAANARDAMGEGGTLTLRCRVAAGAATIEVQDSGRGIPADILPHIFERFFTTRRARGGSGLGLATVQEIVHGLGGTIAAESTVGQGSCFRITLPLETAAPAAIADGVVLLVEDEPTVRRLAERALAQRGWRVLAAESAESALALLAGDAGDALSAIVADAVLPGMDGAALIATLRRVHPGLPAILVSGYAEPAPPSADTVVMTKPYALAELHAALVRLVGG
jgi:two-component system cell cycle sensor histidine kinase/response regulator CckA